MGFGVSGLGFGGFRVYLLALCRNCWNQVPYVPPRIPFEGLYRVPNSLLPYYQPVYKFKIWDLGFRAELPIP